MLRIITGFILLIISHVSFADVIDATQSATYSSTLYSYKSDCSPGWCTYTEFLSSVKALGGTYSQFYSDTCAGFSPVFHAGINKVYCDVSTKLGFFQFYAVATPSYSCPSGYTRSNSAGKPDSAGAYCSKSACADYAGNTTQLWFPINSVPNTGCYAGCKATTSVAVNYDDTSVQMPYVYQTFKISDEVCSGVMDYTDSATAIAANKAAQDAADEQRQKDACGAAGWTSGTSNGQTVITCKVPDSPSTDTGTSTGTDGASSGMGTDAGSPETNTSGSQTGTTGGGTGSLGGSGYGDGGSTGSTGSSTGTDSGSSTGGDSSTGTGTDGGSSTGGDSSTGTGSGDGSSSGSGSGTGSGDGSGSGSGSGTGSGDSAGADSGSGSGSGSGTGEGSEGEGDSGSASSSDGPYSYSDTERDSRTFTDIFSTHFDELQQTQLFGSASGFFKVSFNGSCSPIEMPFFSGSISLDICSFFDKWSAMISAIVIFACSFFAFRTAME